MSAAARSGSLPRELVIAAVISALAAGIYTVLGVLGSAAPLRWTLAGGLAGYTLLTLAGCPLKAGRVTAGAAALIVPVACFALGFSLAATVAMQLLFAWLVRSLGRHRTLVGMAGDALLTAAAAGLALATFRHTGSVLLGFWVLLFVQALHVFLPGPGKQSLPDARPAGKPVNFDEAERRAEAALTRIFNSQETLS